MLPIERFALSVVLTCVLSACNDAEEPRLDASASDASSAPDSGASDAASAASCEIEGTIVAVGESVTTADGCAICMCEEDGAVSCRDSGMGCSAVGCVHEGMSYADGESIPTDDRCLICTCRRGEVRCIPEPGCT